MVDSSSKLEHRAQCTTQPTGNCAFWRQCVSILDFSIALSLLKEVLSAVVSSKLFRTFLLLPGCLAVLRLYWEAHPIWEWLWTIFTVYNFRERGTHWSQFFPGLLWRGFLRCLLLEITTFLYHKNFHLPLEQKFYCFIPS